MSAKSHYYGILVGAVIFLGIFLFISDDVEVNATTPTEKMALLAYSNVQCNDTQEIEKISSMYDYLVEDGYDNGNIYYYGPNILNNTDGVSNTTNIEDGLESIENDNDTDKEILIYISDHGHADGDVYNLTFTDGIMNSTLINSYICNMSYDELTMVFCGNQSGAAGDYFHDDDIDVISSMGPDDVYSPDEFNLTRSLEDSLADTNSDGEITYIEATKREITVMEAYTTQKPRIWYG